MPATVPAHPGDPDALPFFPHKQRAGAPDTEPLRPTQPHLGAQPRGACAPRGGGRSGGSLAPTRRHELQRDFLPNRHTSAQHRSPRGRPPLGSGTPRFAGTARPSRGEERGGRARSGSAPQRAEGLPRGAGRSGAERPIARRARGGTPDHSPSSVWGNVPPSRVPPDIAALAALRERRPSGGREREGPAGRGRQNRGGRPPPPRRERSVAARGGGGEDDFMPPERREFRSSSCRRDVGVKRSWELLLVEASAALGTVPTGPRLWEGKKGGRKEDALSRLLGR